MWTLHNFHETACLILKYLQENILDEDNYYPDFPTGGIIINKDELSQINKTGKGRVIVQAKYEIEGQSILFTEMPYQVYIEPVIEKIKEQIEKENLLGINDVINKSDKKRILLVVECEKGVNPQKVVDLLFATTPLQMQYNVNQNGIISKTPVLLTLKEVVDCYIEHNTTCIRREFKYEFGVANTRIKILEGLLIAIANLDKVIKLIRESSSPKEELLKAFPELDEEQVKAILDMKLGRLSKLESDKIEKELQEKKEYAAYCKEIMESEQRQKEVLIERLQELDIRYGDKRRTEVVQKEIIKVGVGKAKEKVEEVPQDIVVTYDSNGYIKAVPVAQYKKNKNAKQEIKCTTKDLITLYSSLGKMYRVSVKDIGLSGAADKGKIVTTIINAEKDEKILFISSAIIDDNHPYLTTITNDGLIKKTDFIDLQGTTRNLNGLKYIGLTDNTVSWVGVTNGDFITVYSTDGYALSFELKDLRATGKTSKGVIAIKLNQGAKVSHCELNKLAEGGKLQKRAGKGIQVK